MGIQTNSCRREQLSAVPWKRLMQSVLLDNWLAETQLNDRKRRRIVRGTGYPWLGEAERQLDIIGIRHKIEFNIVHGRSLRLEIVAGWHGRPAIECQNGESLNSSLDVHLLEFGQNMTVPAPVSELQGNPKR